MLREAGYGRLAKGAAGRGEDQALDFARFAGAEALVDGVVFAVYRKKRDAGAGYGGHYHFAGGDQDFFIGQRDVFSVLDGFVGGGKADDADRGGDYDFGVGVSCYSFHAFGAEEDFGLRVILSAGGLQSFTQ